MINETVRLRKPVKPQAFQIRGPASLIKRPAVIAIANEPVKSYPNTLQRLARHFWYAGKDKNILELADELEQRPEIAVICITDEKRRPLGIIRREQLFLLLGKRFGRDIMSRDSTGECAEAVPVYAGERNILAVFELLREQNGEQAGRSVNKRDKRNEYLLLIDSQGVFSGILSLQDVADYMAEMTNDDIAQASLLQERLFFNADEIKQLRVNVDAWWSSAKGVGGDFYFIKKISDRHFFASLCDVSGKGVTAALVVSIVWGFLRSYNIHKGLKDLLINLNASIISSFHMEKYLTGFFLFYDTGSRQLRVADMGHAHSVFLRNGKNVSLKKTRVNLPVGIEFDINPLICSFQVQSGDTLLIFSDGIPEQDNLAGEEFGEDRLINLLQEAVKQNKPLNKILPKALEDFRQNTPQHDDMTFLLFRF